MFSQKDIKDGTIFLYRTDLYDPNLEDTVNSIVINEDLLHVMTTAEKMAIGYIATFIGSECVWDETKENYEGHLKCKVLTALDLGYQCSEKHLGTLRKWFKNDSKALQKLADENCSEVPYTATRQNTFEKVALLPTKKGQIKIKIWASGINMREMKGWEWDETYTFEILDNGLKLLKTDKSEVKYEDFNQPDE